MESVENLVVGEHAYFGGVVHEAFVQCAVYGLEVNFIATVGKDFAQTVELLRIIGEYVQAVSFGLEAYEGRAYYVEIFVVDSLRRAVEVEHGAFRYVAGIGGRSKFDAPQGI